MPSKRNLPLAFLLVAIFLVYSNSFGNAFHFDDFHTVTDNPAVRSLANLPRIFSDTTAFSVLPANQTYRPVVTASLTLDYALGHGYLPFWFHLSTFLWFLVLILVVRGWAQLLFDKIDPQLANGWLAIGVAGWFGLHPVMAETVNYVIQRGDLYCTLGCVSALLLFAKFPFGRRYGLYLLPFVLAMLSKPPASVFPVLLLLYFFFFETDGETIPARWLKACKAAAPSIAVTVALLVLQSAMTPKSYAPSILSAAAYRLTQPFVWLRYASELLVPWHLNVDTDLQPISTLNADAWAGLLFLALMLGCIALCVRRRHLYPIAYGLLWFLITQLPTSLYTLSEVENDHRMFFSFPGLMLAVVWALRLGYQRVTSPRTADDPRQRWLPTAAVALFSATLAAYAFGTHQRNAVWHDEASLWADDVAKSPHNGRGLMIYGLTRMNVGDLEGALRLFTRALEYTPNYATLEINLGIVNGMLADAGQHDRTNTAEAHFQRAILLAPADDLPHAYYGRWLLHNGRVPEATSQLATALGLNGQREMQRDLLLDAYRQAGDLTAARRLAQDTIAAIPTDRAALAVLHGDTSGTTTPEAAAQINASLAAYKAGHFGESITRAQEALKLDPRSAEAWNNVGAGYGALGQWALAAAAEQQALRLNPNLTIAANNLRWFQSEAASGNRPSSSASASSLQNVADLVNLSLSLSHAGKYGESVAAARKAVALDPRSAEAWNNIAAGEEALGHWDEAIDAARQAIALRPDFQLAKNNLAWSLQQRESASRQPKH